MNIFTKKLLQVNHPLRTAAVTIISAGLLLFMVPEIKAQDIAPSFQKNASVINLRNLDVLGGARSSFIENIGQYGDTIVKYGRMGKILYGYEGLDMPVLFTAKGLVHLQRKIEGPSEKELEEKEHKEKKNKHAEEEFEERRAIDRTITMEWLNANPNPEIIPEDKTGGYHTYASLQEKAYSFRKITYRELYPHIDVIYSFYPNKKAGFEFSLLVKPGGDLSLVKMKFGGDIKGIKKDQNGNLTIRSDIKGVTESFPLSYYGEDLRTEGIREVKSVFSITKNEINFSVPEGYDTSKTLVIDPFVSSTGNLTGINAGKAKDVDFDYAGNIYVTGGGDGNTTHSLAKFNSAGVLQWTFNGTLAIPSWTFGTYFGGWMVEKPTGNVYLGQGFDPATGFQVIRISTTGLYDNYITTANPNFLEAWKMYWSCNNGSPQILVAGGGTNSDINFGVFTPPATAIGSLNVTGIPYTGTAGWAQDIVDVIIDPSNNDMYTIYGSLFGNPSLTNKIYKNTAPYSAASMAWNVPSGFVSVEEISNRPYLVGGPIDNSANIFAINGSYLYYWDGKNLKAFDKGTGNGVGAPLTTANTTLMQGGIVADACNNVFVGDGNGIIKVYKFNGSTFDDAAEPDITIPGFAGKAVYDLAYDESKKLLYASGDGFVASFDVSVYCPSTQYKLNVVPDCLTASATITVTPVPPAGSTITYVLYNGATQLATNTTGIFSGLSPNVTYKVVATINLACSGTQATTSFTLPGPTIAVTHTNTTCGASIGALTATGSGSTAPYSYSKDGVNFQASGTFTGLAAGVYTITAKDANGCENTIVVTILNSNGPLLTFTVTNADCGNNNGTITTTVTGGTTPYQFSINGTTYQSSNFFTGLVGGTYTLTVKDAVGCTNAAVITITSSPSPFITAIPAAATCGSSNGTITAFGSGGTPPLQYSVNGNVFQASNAFTNLTPGTYSVTAKDVNGCTKSVPVTIDNSPAPSVSAVSTPAACNNINGTITATGIGGIAPLQFSISGTTFQTGNIFTGLAAGIYAITVKDATGCTNITQVTVSSTGGPAVTATSTVSACNINNGSITATARGGVPGYQYSIDGTTFQVSNIFSGLGAGSYVVYVRDAAGCIGTVTIVVGNTAGPSITAASTPTACNTNTGKITATGTGGTAPLQFSIDGITYQAGNIFTGLAAGIYTVYVKDANGCIKTTTITISNVSGLSLTVSSLSSSSCLINDATITATARGGIAPLQYNINGGTFQGSNIFSGLAPGIYTVSVKDANACIVTEQTTVVSVAGPALVVTVPLNATCGAASGVVVASGTGGLDPLTYNIDGGAFQLSGIFVGVAAGSHTIVVKDASGCTATRTVTVTNSGSGTAITDVTFRTSDVLVCTGSAGRITNLKGLPNGGGNKYTFSLDFGPFTNSNRFVGVSVGTHTITAMNQDGCSITKLVTIGNGIPATATATSTGTPCNTNNGTITITGVGANTPYHASIDNGVTWITFFPPGANSFTFTGLAPGIYPIIIADDADFTVGPPDVPGACLTTIFVAVPSTGGPSISTTQSNPTCTSNNGNITATGSGGTPPYQYSINGGAFFASGVFNNLTSGVYAVSIKDATGCISGTNVTLAKAPVPAVSADILATSCNLNNGKITATGTGGAAPLKYSINGTTFQSSNIFSNLTPGNYTLYVADANGCFSTLPVTIANTPLPKVTAFTIAATCNTNDGSIVAEGAGGEVPYSFSVNATVYQSSGTFSGLAAGFYTVYVKDNRGCITTTGVSVANISTLTITNITPTPATCGNATGSISVSVTGGTVPLQYSINGITFQISNIFSNLAPGNYTVTVKDANGCTTTNTVAVGNISGPQVRTTVILDAACGLNNGTITATASGGTGVLTYSKDGTIFQPVNVFSNLAAGTYTIIVRDANGCIKTSQANVINLSGPTLTTTSSAASCGLGDGTITAETSGGTGVITYSEDGVTFQASNIFLGLAAGPYTITAKDARGCTGTSNITVSTTGTTIIPTFNPIAAICSGAVLPPLPTSSTNAIPITGTWSPALNNIATTTYTFTPNAGQCASTTTMTIVVNPSIVPTFNPIPAICTGAVLAPLPTSSMNASPITGTWSPALNNIATTTYTFTPNAGQCASTTTMTIVVNPSIVPTFNPIPAICTGAVLAPLPTSSTNAIPITGTWSPALNNTATTTYTFTPNAGQCASTTTLTITVSPNIVPTFNPIAAICSGGILAPLPTSSTNAVPITGTWSPALNNTTTTTYTFIPNAGQCASTTTITIVVNPSPSAPSVNITQPTCTAPTATIFITSASAGLTFSFDNAAYTSYPPGGYLSIVPGSHTLTAKNSNGCVSGTQNFVVNNPPLSPSAIATTVTNTTCGTANGILTLGPVTGGLSPYSYSVDGNGFSVTLVYPNLSAGSHSIIVKDANGCTFATSAIINNTNGPTVAAISVNSTCGNSNGSITAIGTSGITPYQYSINGTTFQANNVFSGLAAGPYTVTIKDANNCANSTSITIVNTNGATVTATATNASCGASNGSITATGTGGTIPYQYSINGTTFQASNLFGGLAAGPYAITIKDANNCNNTTSITIANTNGAIVTAIATNASCGASNGSITATGTGGTIPYQYSIDGTTFQGSNLFGGLAAGLYTIIIKDANNCTNTTSVSVGNSNGATVTAIATNASCGVSNGTITATGTGGTIPYQYSINGTTFQASNLFGGLAAGPYTITIKDANNCTNTTSVSVGNSNGATVTATATNASCGVSNGTITATGTGGTTPYKYSIDGITFQTSNVFTNLSVNTYTVTIKDANNCTNTTSVSVGNSNGATVTAIATNASCGVSNGTITATGIDGTIPYQYSIDGTIFQASDLFNGLAAGPYTITIKDANNCTNTTSVSVGNSNGATVTATATNASCGVSNGTITATGTGGTTPYKYSIDGTIYQSSNIFSNLAANNYTLTIKDANNCTNSISVTIAANNLISVNAGADITICEGDAKQLSAVSSGTTFSWSPTTGLNDATVLNPVASPVKTTLYKLTAKSGTCSKSDSMIIFVNQLPLANAGADARICSGENLQLTGTGGVIFEWSPPAYLSNTHIPKPVVVSPPSGILTYLLNVTDRNGCKSSKSDTVVVTILPPAEVFAGRDTSITVNEPLRLDAIDISNSGFKNYLWSPAIGLNNNLVKNPVAILTQGVTYTVTARTPEGCEASDDIIITVFKRPELYVPTAFTPNGDNLNDVARVITVGIKELKYFNIYNRWGELVFSTADASKGWDGIYKGTGQNTGVFVWAAEAIDYNGNVIKRNGMVTLIR